LPSCRLRHEHASSGFAKDTTPNLHGRSVEYVRTSLVVQEGCKSLCSPLDKGGGGGFEQMGVLACYAKNSLHLHSLPLLIRSTKSAIILQSAWSGQGLHLCCPKGERRMHTRNCVLAKGACRVA